MRFDRAASGGRAKSDDERILPLINVVFLLLIFFMIAGKLSASDPFEIAPPTSQSEGLAGERDLRVLVGADGKLALDGTVLSAEALAQEVAARVAENPDVRLQLKADAGAEATAVVGVMERLRDAGLRTLTLLTVPEAR